MQAMLFVKSAILFIRQSVNGNFILFSSSYTPPHSLKHTPPCPPGPSDYHNINHTFCPPHHTSSPPLRNHPLITTTPPPVFIDAPVCKSDQPMYHGAARHEQVNIPCYLEAHPLPYVFTWTFNNSGESVKIPQVRLEYVGLSSVRLG